MADKDIPVRSITVEEMERLKRMLQGQSQEHAHHESKIQRYELWIKSLRSAQVDGRSWAKEARRAMVVELSDSEIKRIVHEGQKYDDYLWDNGRGEGDP
jgi:hypothetical protein